MFLLGINDFFDFVIKNLTKFMKYSLYTIKAASDITPISLSLSP